MKLISCEFSSDHSLQKYIALKSEKQFPLKTEGRAVLSLCWRHMLNFKSRAKPLRNSRSQMFFIMGALKDFFKFDRKTAVLESFFNKLQSCRPVTLLNRDFNTGVFLSNLKNF